MNSWEKQETESEKEYQKFLIYKDLGPKRSLLQAERKASNQPEKGQVSGYWNSICRRNKWKARAQAADTVSALVISAAIQSNHERAAEEQEGMIADASALVRRYVAKAAGLDDKSGLKLLKQLVGLPGHFVLESHKTLFGEKTEINSTSKEWKVLSFKKLE